jgi:hypothetical protein
MATQTYEVSNHSKIKVRECLGDLTIKAKETSEISVQAGRDEDLNVVSEGDTLVIDSRANCQVTCPHDFALNIEAVRGNLWIKALHGDLTIGEVNGNAILRDGGATTVEQVYGSFRAQQIAGALRVQSVAGDARVDGVAGEAKIERVGSDLRAGGLTAGLIAEAVGSDVRLDPPFAAGATYRVRAGSDLRVRLPEDANVRFDLRAGSGVRSKVPTLELEETNGHVTGVLGETGEEGEEGEESATLVAQVGGRIVISAAGVEGEYVEDFDVNIDLSFLDSLDEIGPMIESRVAEAMAELDVQLQKGLSFLESDRFRGYVEEAAEKAERAAERISEKARVMVERETERARRAAEKEAQRARIRAEQAERRWQRASGRRSAPSAPSAPAAPPEPSAPAASSKESKSEERMHVLRMVEEGKLSPDEAANLLQALQ